MSFAASLESVVLALEIGLIGWMAAGVVFVLLLLFVVIRVTRPGEGPTREQRPFHICPECTAYNAKAEAMCWRCNHDMSKGAIASSGDMRQRLESLDSARDTRG